MEQLQVIVSQHIFLWQFQFNPKKYDAVKNVLSLTFVKCFLSLMQNLMCSILLTDLNHKVSSLILFKK
jgi:hypothetical protein